MYKYKLKPKPVNEIDPGRKQFQEERIAAFDKIT